MQTENPDLDDAEYENIPNPWPWSEINCAPEFAKMTVIFDGSRYGELLFGEVEQLEQYISIVDFIDTDGTVMWPNFIRIDVSDVQTDAGKVVSDALIERVESNVE